MKKGLILLFMIMLVFPSLVNAHSELEASNPSEGQVVKKEIKKVTLTFGTNIEKLSSMKLLKDGKEIPFNELDINNEKLIGNLNESLQNGEYIIEWKIIGEDGHPIVGKVPFSVQIGTISKKLYDEEHKINDKKLIRSKSIIKEENEKKSESIMNTVIVILGIVLITSFIFLLKKGRKK